MNMEHIARELSQYICRCHEPGGEDRLTDAILRLVFRQPGILPWPPAGVPATDLGTFAPLPGAKLEALIKAGERDSTALHRALEAGNVPEAGEMERRLSHAATGVPPVETPMRREQREAGK
jgi:hypothetical protein